MDEDEKEYDGIAANLRVWKAVPPKQQGNPMASLFRTKISYCGCASRDIRVYPHRY